MFNNHKEFFRIIYAQHVFHPLCGHKRNLITVLSSKNILQAPLEKLPLNFSRIFVRFASNYFINHIICKVLFIVKYDWMNNLNLINCTYLKIYYKYDVMNYLNSTCSRIKYRIHRQCLIHRQGCVSLTEKFSINMQTTSPPCFVFCII